MKYYLFLFLSICASLRRADDPLKAKLDTGSYAEVNAKALKAIIDSGVPVTLLDTRPNLSKGDKQIPKSIHLKADSSDREILAALPAKNALIITYCEDLKCREDADLAAHLISMGYKNVIEYTAGVNDWVSSDYPVELIR